MSEEEAFGSTLLKVAIGILLFFVIADVIFEIIMYAFPDLSPIAVNVYSYTSFAIKFICWIILFYVIFKQVRLCKVCPHSEGMTPDGKPALNIWVKYCVWFAIITLCIITITDFLFFILEEYIKVVKQDDIILYAYNILSSVAKGFCWGFLFLFLIGVIVVCNGCFY